MIHIILLYLKNKRYVKRFKEMVHILFDKRLLISSSCRDKKSSHYIVLLNSAANLTKTRNYKISLDNFYFKTLDITSLKELSIVLKIVLVIFYG